MFVKYIYSSVYAFYKKKNMDDEFMAWYYTVSAIGFLITMNLMSVYHIVFKDITATKIEYIGLGIFLWSLSFFYFFMINKKAKKSVLIDKEELPKYSGLLFFIYFLLSQTIFFYTLILSVD